MINSNSLTALAFKLIAEKKPNNFAGTLIDTSTREKVTSPSQSVGGPVDVAAITRSEGLVWVKRKEYFASAKNPHYVLRQQQHYRAQEQQ